MPHNDYVVKFNDTTDLYLTVFNPNYDRCQWGQPSEALTFETLNDAQAIATMIDSGTVGTTKPQ